MLREQLLADPAISADPMSLLLLPVLLGETGTTSSGWPYLEQPGFEHFRDRVPHILGMGPLVDASVYRIRERAKRLPTGEVEPERMMALERAAQVVSQMVDTAAVTAPPTLWLLRHVGAALAQVGVLTRLLDGEVVDPERSGLVPDELATDLALLQVTGLVVKGPDGFRRAPHSRAEAVLTTLLGVPAPGPDSAELWRAALSDQQVGAAELIAQASDPPARVGLDQDTWMPTPEEVLLGGLLVPVALGLHAAGSLVALAAGQPVAPADLGPPALGAAALAVLEAAGVVSATAGGRWVATGTGRRVLGRGIGAFGIIGAYHPYLSELVPILRRGRSGVHVRRGANIAASQKANRATFEGANDALDIFCRETGFTWSVFIEHAMGRGEATRQRHHRSGDAPTYVGADLEDDAIDAALEQQAAGNLPEAMILVRDADIGEPRTLLEPLARAGVDTQGAVMLVGNGFHEVRDQSDEAMITVFRAWCDAGIVLLFTEETALSVRDQLATAWNTYHQGFRYVHEKSGQGLRPADRAESDADVDLPMSWSECARAAGYHLVDKLCRRGRTIYPYSPPDGRNPSTSVNYFAVPRAIAEGLKAGGGSRVG